MVALPAADTRNFGLQGACMGLNSPALTACGSRRGSATVGDKLAGVVVAAVQALWQAWRPAWQTYTIQSSFN